MATESQQRDPLDRTVNQARNTTIASLVCAQVLLVAASAAITADAAPDVYVVNTGSASVTMTLPPLADVPEGRELSFWKGSSASNSMIVDGYASETIEGSANVTRTARYSVITVKKVRLTDGPPATFGWMLVKTDAATGGIDSAQIADGAIDLVHMSANSVDSDQYVDGSIDLVHMSANSVDSPQYVDGSIDPEHFAAAAGVGATLGGGTRANTVDTAVVLAAADGMTVVTISSTAGAGTRTITRGTLPVGVPVMVVMTAYDTNAYTAAVQGGTVTFNAVGEAGIFVYDGTALRFIPVGDVPATFA
jgi:hypothetical protein